jgi:outer membrane protein insertion porin family
MDHRCALDRLMTIGQGDHGKGVRRRTSKGGERVTATRSIFEAGCIASALLVGSAAVAQGTSDDPSAAAAAPTSDTTPAVDAPAAPAATTAAPAATPAAPEAPAAAGGEARAEAIANASGVIRSVAVTGSERLEPDTVRSYAELRAGEPYDREKLDTALKALYATELFADVQIHDDNGALTIAIRENPVINRIVLEGNKRLKEDKIKPEIRLAPRQIFTRSKARADVARIVELYRRQGRFAATVEPKIVQLDQNRVDVIFEINEGPKSKVRQINIIGNTVFSDGEIRSHMATKQSRFFRIFSSSTGYDPDKLTYDQQKLRQFYLTQGYADFRVVSAVAELTPDRRDFIITYVVEEGKRYKFGDIKLESDIRDLKSSVFQPLIALKKGEWYNAQRVEDTVDALTNTAGNMGYAFADIRPDFNRHKDDLTMGVTFKVADAPRVYVERININGNTHTKDKVVRREFRLAEGDAFNNFKVKRSKDRIQSLGFFQEKFEISQKQGSAPDRVILEANVEEKSTGELQVSAGFSSLEKFILSLAVTEHNFMGKGQEVRASVDYSSYSKSINLGFTEPYLFNKNIAVGGDIFRRDYSSFNYLNGNDRNRTYSQVSTGFQLRAGIALTEYWSLALRYGLTFDKVTLDKNNYFSPITLPNGDPITDPNDPNFGRSRCDPIIAGRYLCDSLGNRLTSSIGYSLVFDNLNNRVRPSRGNRIVFSQDFAGVGGSVRYLRSRLEAAKYWALGRTGFVLSAKAEGGMITGLGQRVFLTDRFYLGDPDVRGFDIRGIGPRVIRHYDPGGDRQDDAIGGRYYYSGKLELEIPLGSGAREMGLRPSVFMDVGSVWGTTKRDRQLVPTTLGVTTKQFVNKRGDPLFIDAATQKITTRSSTVVNGVLTPNTPFNNSIPAFHEEFLGDTPKPRLSVGFGVNWNSPFGPFRIDIAKALLKVKGDDTKLFSFNVGTQF